MSRLERIAFTLLTGGMAVSWGLVIWAAMGVSP